MKLMPLYRRLFGSIIDKLLILLFFLLGFAAVEGNKSIDRGFTYLSIGNCAPSMYEYVTLNSLYIIDIGYPVKYSPRSEEELIEWYAKNDYVGMVKAFDLTITFSFIILNILYYLLSELFLGASVGKYLMRGRAVDYLLGERITSTDAFKRAIIGGLLMFLAVGLRFLFDVSYLIVIVLFFLIIDIFIFFKRRSLIDILSKVSYIDRQSVDNEVIFESFNMETVEEKKPIETEKVVENMDSEKAPINSENIIMQQTCKHCGKEIAEGSIYCQYCGKLINNSLDNVVKENHTKTISCGGFLTSYNKKCLLLYVIWLVLNLFFLCLGESEIEKGVGGDGRYVEYTHTYSPKDYFFPFTDNKISYNFDVDYYDFTEFIFYAILIPLLVLFYFQYLHKPLKKKCQRRIK